MLRFVRRIVARSTGLELTGIEAALRGTLALLPHAGPGLRIGRNVDFVGPPRNFRLGRDVALLGNAYLNATGPGASLSIGDRTHIDQFCVLYGQGGLRIGARCAIAASVVIYLHRIISIDTTLPRTSSISRHVYAPSPSRRCLGSAQVPSCFQG